MVFGSLLCELKSYIKRIRLDNVGNLFGTFVYFFEQEEEYIKGRITVQGTQFTAWSIPQATSTPACPMRWMHTLIERFLLLLWTFRPGKTQYAGCFESIFKIDLIFLYCDASKSALIITCATLFFAATGCIRGHALDFLVEVECDWLRTICRTTTLACMWNSGWFATARFNLRRQLARQLRCPRHQRQSAGTWRDLRWLMRRNGDIFQFILIFVNKLWFYNQWCVFSVMWSACMRACKAFYWYIILEQVFAWTRSYLSSVSADWLDGLDKTKRSAVFSGEVHRFFGSYDSLCEDECVYKIWAL